VPGVLENPMDEASLKAESRQKAMKRGRGCECVMHKLASLQPIHAQNDTVAVVVSRASPTSKPPYSLKDEDRKDLRKSIMGA
jgi:hypothetical protein